jgi:hypothetical protein
MSNFQGKARAALDSPELRGFAALEGREEGPRSGGFVDTDLLIRAALFLGANVIRYRDAEKRVQTEKREQVVSYRKVEPHWNRAVDGFRKTVETYKNAGVPDGTWLPYRYLLLPPAIAAANGYPLGNLWIGWAIAASLWRHYVGEVDTKLQKDADLAAKGDIHGLIDHVKTRTKRIESVVPEVEDFTENIVSDGGVFFAMLVHFARIHARSFPGSKLLAGADEPIEVHHIFPRAFLDTYQNRDNEFILDRLGNLTLLTRSDNEHLGDLKPKDYIPSISESERGAHFIPEDASLWSIERYPDFCKYREEKLGECVRELFANLGIH